MSATPYDAVRPYAILAVAAFVLGFAGYVALDRPALAAGLVTSPAPSSVIVEPAAGAPAAPADGWNFPKKI
jgi:hypothetical protein